MRPLRFLLPRGRKLVMLALLVLAGLVLALFLFSILEVQLAIDAAAILWALAVLLAVGVAYLLVRHWIKPRQTLSLGFHVRLDQPSVPVVGRYAFRLEIFYEVEEKGERARIDQGTIEMRFRRRDHPEMLQWCCLQVSEHLEKHASFAAERYPGARILMPPRPTPAMLAAQVGESALESAREAAVGP